MSGFRFAAGGNIAAIAANGLDLNTQFRIITFNPAEVLKHAIEVDGTNRTTLPKSNGKPIIVLGDVPVGDAGATALTWVRLDGELELKEAMAFGFDDPMSFRNTVMSSGFGDPDTSYLSERTLIPPSVIADSYEAVIDLRTFDQASAEQVDLVPAWSVIDYLVWYRRPTCGRDF